MKPRDLAPQYQEWLKLTTYIIKDKERDVFLSLTNDRDRDLFIETFWKIRDPTPETPDNEFKQEHIKRFQEANKRFRRRSAREGWMTDQGRIWIILGQPVQHRGYRGLERDLSLRDLVLLRRCQQGDADPFRPGFFPMAGGGRIQAL